jgi:hypothetical protein
MPTFYLQVSPDMHFRGLLFRAPFIGFLLPYHANYVKEKVLIPSKDAATPGRYACLGTVCRIANCTQPAVCYILDTLLWLNLNVDCSMLEFEDVSLEIFIYFVLSCMRLNIYHICWMLADICIVSLSTCRGGNCGGGSTIKWYFIYSLRP